MASPQNVRNLKINGVEYIAIRELKHDLRNARRHPPEQIEALKAIIREVGFVDPVIIDSANIVQAGNGALQAARELGLTEVPYVRLSHLSHDQLRAFRLAHNRLAEKSEWDDLILRQEIELLPPDLLPLTGLDDFLQADSLSLPALPAANPAVDDDEDEEGPEDDRQEAKPEGIRILIPIEVTKLQAHRARALRKAHGFDGDWSGFFFHLLDT